MRKAAPDSSRAGEWMRMNTPLVEPSSSHAQLAVAVDEVRVAGRQQRIVGEENRALGSADDVLGAAQLVGQTIAGVGLDQHQLGDAGQLNAGEEHGLAGATARGRRGGAVQARAALAAEAVILGKVVPTTRTGFGRHETPPDERRAG